MKLWLLLVLVFLIQEPISTSAVLFTAYQDHYSVWLIHGLFVVATVFDVVITYYIGVFIQRRFGDRKLTMGLKKKLESFAEFIGEKGKVIALIVYAPMIFPISGILVPWLDISLAESIICLLIGEAIFWYAYVWLLVLGVKSFASNAQSGLYLILIVAAAFTLGTKYFLRKSSKKKSLDVGA